MDILIAGGNGGIGLAMVKAVMTHFDEGQIYATYHRQRPDYQPQRLTWLYADLTVEENVKALSESIPQLDWVIITSGQLHHQTQGPEKRITQFDHSFYQHIMAQNTLPSMLLAKYFAKQFSESEQPKLAAISARVGSISDNRLGGWYSYRASKAALNQLLKTLAIEWQRTLKQGVVLALHPGTTDTELSKPFQRNVPAHKLFTPEVVAKQLLAIIRQSTPEQSGQFLAYDGGLIPW